MFRSSVLAITFALAMLANISTTAVAVPSTDMARQLGTTTSTSMTQNVGYRRACWRVRRMCAYRWPGLGWRFDRCMAIRGC